VRRQLDASLCGGVPDQGTPVVAVVMMLIVAVGGRGGLRATLEVAMPVTCQYFSQRYANCDGHTTTVHHSMRCRLYYSRANPAPSKGITVTQADLHRCQASVHLGVMGWRAALSNP
jgi:hypothetical protein